MTSREEAIDEIISVWKTCTWECGDYKSEEYGSGDFKGVIEKLKALGVTDEELGKARIREEDHHVAIREEMKKFQRS